MSSIFLRIYGGLLFTLVLVAVLCGLALTIINGVRLQDFRESTARGTFRVMSLELASVPEKSWPGKLELWENRLGIRLSVVPAADENLGSQTARQLQAGRVLVRGGDSGQFEVFSSINEASILRGTIDDINEQLATGTATIVRDWLSSIPPARRILVLADRTNDLFGYPVKVLDHYPGVFSQRQRGLLEQGMSLALFNQAGHAMNIYTRLPDTGKIVVLGPVAMLNPYPFKLLGTIGLFILASISIAIYVLVRGLERRLSKLERAARRLARGDLDARVKIHGGDSVGQLAAAFNNMASYIQRLLSIQKEMIRGVSHELRTPVARIRFGLEMVEDAQSADERSGYIKGIDGDIEELDKLVDEILTYAKLEEGVPDIRFQRLDVDSIVARVTEEHQRQKSSVVVEHVPCRTLEARRRIDVEERYIHRAIQNLVSNACRYADSTVQVRFSAGHDTCRVDVEDDGPGIPEEQRERVFTAFARLDDSRTRSSGGYGLGLSIVRRIMHWHNGKAMVGVSDKLGGARFSLVWPRRQRGR
ncbi:ATP-binding protein [Sansalvadorimonas verongulae]|uniref:ATP-binding protein n=1 Tax=Sansalvadorimonas verongulae TaxID=2172824 RepID=UPI0012BC1F4D|nr:ATP-binding protein [Sansalvadorimonas verongulae]MTI13551.1 HAMP domain-containing protein [Sansalvadorimonas verongulae]